MHFSHKALLKSALLSMALLGSVDGVAQASFGSPECFDDGWRFSLSDDSLARRPQFNDSNWRQLDLPHDWSIEGQLSPSLASCTGYLPGGIAWYRKTFEVTDNKPRHYIYFEGVYNRSEVYLNGHLLGKRPNGYASFMYDLTPYLKKGQNVLSVRVDHSQYADSRWYTGSGIYRDVWLIAAPETHFAQWGVGWKATSISKNKATVVVDVDVETHINPTSSFLVNAQLLDADGKVVVQKQLKVGAFVDGHHKMNVALNVPKPQLWDLEHSYLYTLKTEITEQGTVIDQCENKVGLRTLQFTPNKGFALNGRNMKVKGVCIHHDAGALGAVVPPEVWERRLRNLKDMGANALRLSHNPQAPVVYDLCDKIGLLVMDEASDEWEFPKRKWIEGWNNGKPGYQGTFDFFEEWIDRDVTDMVRRDRNHPSVFLWSIGNEVDYPNDPYSHPILNGAKINQPMYGGYKPDAPDARRIGTIAKRLSACVRAVDTSRPVTGALAGVIMSNETEYPEAIDVVGYNYTENRFDEDHAKYPKRVIYASETGSGLSQWRDVQKRDFIFGQFIWTGLDYLGESGRWPSRGLNTGLLNFAGFRKPRGQFRASLWCEKPMTYIGTYPNSRHLSIDAPDVWNYKEGQPIKVVCYTNAPQARLLLNGKTVGEMKPYNEESGIIDWTIPYQAGTLTAEGCDKNGKVLSLYTIETSDRPYALQAEPDVTKLSKHKATAQILVKVMDKDGKMVKLADNNITCHIQGPARLLGMEGSDNADMGNYRDNQQRVHNGYLLTYVQTTGQAGDVTLTFTSPLLKECKVNLTVE